MQKGGAVIPDDSQENWRWCKKCQVLAFAGNPSTACAAGGVHDYTSSGNYVLETVVGADTVLHNAYMKALKPQSAAAVA